MEASTKESRAMAAEFRAMEKAEFFTPSEKARAIVRARNEKGVRESLETAARDMGISANELAAEILAERAMNDVTPVKESRETEFGYSVIDSRERRSLVKATILAEHATRPDYRIARELLSEIGREYGVVVSSLPNGTIRVSATKKAIDPEYARALQERAIAGTEKVAARIESAEKAIENAPLKKGTPAMQKELADAERAMVIARQRLVKANVRAEHAKAISADGIRLEYVAEFDFESMPGEKAIESWELPNAIVRRPFREYIRVNPDRKNVSDVEVKFFRAELEKENEAIRAMVKAEIESAIAEKANAEKLEKENKKSANAAARKLANTIRMRNARMAKRNAR